MSNRVYGRNAFETSLNGAIGGGDTSIALTSATGLTAPGYVVIDPGSPTKREYIKFTGIATNTLTGVSRGLDGSASGGQPHDSGTTVRMVFVHQYLNDIFTDIEALEAADSDHFGGTDVADHPEATTGVRGFMSAADKTKVDNLDPNLQHAEDHASRHEQGGADPLTMAAVLDLVYPVGSIYLSVTATDPGTIFGGTWARIGEGRTLVGLDAGDTDFDTLEETGGSKTQATHTHSGPSHTHTGPSHTHSNPNVNSNGSHAHSQGSTSSAGSHDHDSGDMAARIAMFDGELFGDRASSLPSGAYNIDMLETITQDSASGTRSHGTAIDGRTESEGSHSHTNPNVNSNGSHVHSQSNTGSAGTGNTGASGTGQTGAGGGESIVQPYLVVNMWKRTA